MNFDPDLKHELNAKLLFSSNEFELPSVGVQKNQHRVEDKLGYWPN